jgi:hypothetical protein
MDLLEPEPLPTDFLELPRRRAQDVSAVLRKLGFDAKRAPRPGPLKMQRPIKRPFRGRVWPRKLLGATVLGSLIAAAVAPSIYLAADVQGQSRL